MRFLRPKEGHNPVFTNLSILIRGLEDYFEENPNTNDERRLKLNEKILEKLDDALSGTASLSIIAEAVRQLFYFTPSERTDRERYTNIASRDNSFAGDTDDLVNILTNMRLKRNFSYENYRNLQVLSRKIRDDFYDSKLRDALREYVVSLDDLLEKTLLEANKRLNKERFEDILYPAYNKICDYKSSRSEPLLVLCDYYLLQETLRNIFYNLRYSFPEERRSDLPRDILSISLHETPFTVKPDNQRQDGIVFELFVRGNAPSVEDLLASEKTIADQLFKLQEFGAQWELLSRENFKRFCFETYFPI